MDPKDPFTGKFFDGLNSSGDKLFFYYEECYKVLDYEPDLIPEGTTCMNKTEISEFYNQNTVLIEFYESKTKIDYSLKENYIYS